MGQTASPEPAVDRASVAELDDVLEALNRMLEPVQRLGIAFSGGVDSTLLLALSARVLGTANVVAILAVSPSLAADERLAARATASVLRTPLVELPTRELDRSDYRANRVDRCFFCKNELFTRIDEELLAQHGLDAVAYGENADDLRRPDRPGSRAAVEHGVLRPLARLGLTKVQVRRLARTLELPNADKAAAPCLASRIPHHQDVTAAKLGQIDRAEAALRRLGFAELRVRHHGDSARIELAHRDLPRALREPLRSEVLRAVGECGFPTVQIDPAGISSGAFTLSLLASARTAAPS